VRPNGVAPATPLSYRKQTVSTVALGQVNPDPGSTMAADRRIICLGDISFASIDLLNDVRLWVTMITRLRLDAALHKPPPPRLPNKVGRPPIVGKRLPTLKQRFANPKTRWRNLLVTGWYGRGERMVEIISGTALWNNPGRRVPIRYVLVRDPTGELEPQAFLCTDLDAAPLDILRWFVRRWSIEVTFAEVPRHLGRRDPATVLRTGNRPHHTGPARHVLPHHPLGQ
jgi:hypothetical protein